jgi:hypothetical protein
MPVKKAFRESFESNFGAILVNFYRFYLPYMLARRKFYGDWDTFIIMIVLCERTIAGAENWPLAESIGTKTELDPKPINAQSIADYTGIPKATVARKVRELKSRGWISRSSSGHLRAAPQFFADARPLTMEFARFAEGWGSMIADIYVDSLEKLDN